MTQIMTDNDLSQKKIDMISSKCLSKINIHKCYEMEPSKKRDDCVWEYIRRMNICVAPQITFNNLIYEIEAAERTHKTNTKVE